jgi:hypothetical protein
MKIEADPRTDEMDDRFLECRESGHNWTRIGKVDPIRAAQLMKERSWERVRRCTQCGAVRTDLYEFPSMALIKRKTDYPEGYLVKDPEFVGMGRVNGAPARLALFLRENPELRRKTRRGGAGTRH